MRVLLKALHVSPNNLQLWYNLALARETFAVAVLQKEQKGEARTLAEVENAIEDLKVHHIWRCWPNPCARYSASLTWSLCFCVLGLAHDMHPTLSRATIDIC